MSRDKRKQCPLQDDVDKDTPPPYAAGPSTSRPQPSDKRDSKAPPPSYDTPPWRLFRFLPDQTEGSMTDRERGMAIVATDITPIFKSAAAGSSSFSPHTITKLGRWDWSHPPWWKDGADEMRNVELVDMRGWTYSLSVDLQGRGWCRVRPEADSGNTPDTVPEGQWTWAGRSGVGIVDGQVWELPRRDESPSGPTLCGRRKHHAQCLLGVRSLSLGDCNNGFRAALRDDGTLLAWSTRSLEYERAAGRVGRFESEVLPIPDLTQTRGTGYIFQPPPSQPRSSAEAAEGWIRLHALAHTVARIPLADQGANPPGGARDEGERVVQAALGHVLVAVKANGELWVGTMGGRTYDPPAQTMMWSLLGVVDDPHRVGITVSERWVGLYRAQPHDDPVSETDDGLKGKPDVTSPSEADAYDAYIIYVHHDHHVVQINPVKLSGRNPPSPIVELALEAFSHRLDEAGTYIASARTASGHVHFWKNDTEQGLRRLSTSTGPALQMVKPVSSTRVEIPPGLYPTSVAVGCVMCVRTEEWRREDEPKAVWFGEERGFKNLVVGLFRGKGKGKAKE